MKWKVKLSKRVNIIVGQGMVFNKTEPALIYRDEIMSLPSSPTFVHANDLIGKTVELQYLGHQIYDVWEIIEAERVE